MFRIAVIGLVLSIILGAQHAIAQSSVAEKKRALIVELLEVTEASNVGIQVGTAMLKQLTPVFTKQFGEEKGKRVSQIFREKWAVVVKEKDVVVVVEEGTIHVVVVEDVEETIHVADAVAVVDVAV